MSPPATAEPLPAPPARLRWSATTVCGPVRPRNEDAFLALAFDGHDVRYLGKSGAASLGGNDFVFAVSDGMGGANAGAFASRVTIEKISQLLPAAFRLNALGMKSGFSDVLTELFSTIHHALLQLAASYEECRGMGTTLSLAWITPAWVYFAHVGDSRIYRLTAAGELKQLTHDHTHAGWLRRQGHITEREARSHPLRHALHQALGGGGQFVEPQIGAVDYQPGDRFLLCSDGLIDGLWDHHLQDLLPQTPPPDRTAAENLVAEALERSGRDNTTAVIVEFAPADKAS